MKIDVLIKAGKKESKVIKKGFANYEVWVKAKPIKGAANKELIKTLASYFNEKESMFRIIKGLTSQIKVVEFKK